MSQSHALPFHVCRDELHSAPGERSLNRRQGARATVDEATLKAIHRVRTDDRAISQLLLRPPQERTRCANLPRRDHRPVTEASSLGVATRRYTNHLIQ